MIENVSGFFGEIFAEPADSFIVSRMGKGKKRRVMFVNIFVANRIRRMEFLYCHIRGGMLQKFHSSFFIDNSIT